MTESGSHSVPQSLSPGVTRPTLSGPDYITIVFVISKNAKSTLLDVTLLTGSRLNVLFASAHLADPSSTPPQSSARASSVYPNQLIWNYSNQFYQSNVDQLKYRPIAIFLYSAAAVLVHSLLPDISLNRQSWKL